MLAILEKLAGALWPLSVRKSLLTQTAAQIGSLAVAHRSILQFAPNGSLSEKGYISNGTRNLLRAGKYVITYEFHANEEAYSPRLVFDVVQWNTEADGATIAETTASLLPGAARTVLFSLAFELSSDAVIEARVWSDANGPKLGLKRVVVDLVELPASFNDHIAFVTSANRKAGRRRFRSSANQVCVVPKYAASETSEIWFHIPITAKGAAILQFEDDSKDQDIVEIGNIQSAGHFQLRASGEVVAFFKVRPSSSNRLAGNVTGRLRIGGDDIPLPLIRLSREFQKPGVWDAGAGLMPARHVIVQQEGAGTARLMRWHLRRNHQHIPLVEGRDLEISDATGAMDLGRADVALLVFEKSKKEGAIRISYGGQSMVLDLQSETTGIRTVILPRDFDDLRGNARFHDNGKSHTTECEVIVTGLRNLESNGSEVIVKHLWDEYPVRKGSLKAMRLAGNWEAGHGEVKIWEGTISLPLKPRVAIELHRHNWSGMAVLRAGALEWVVDLYGERPDRVLFVPSLERPLIDPEDEQSQISVSPVHPALKGLFRGFRAKI